MALRLSRACAMEEPEGEAGAKEGGQISQQDRHRSTDEHGHGIAQAIGRGREAGDDGGGEQRDELGKAQRRLDTGW